MKIDSLFIFLAGAGIGSLATYYIVSKKFDEISKREIEEVRAMYEKRNVETCTDDSSEEFNFKKNVDAMKETQEELAKKAVNKRDITDYNKIIKKEEYKDKEEKEVNIDDEIEFYPDDFGEDNDVVYATYYADGYLIDDDDHMIDTDLVGGRNTIKEQFGNGEDPNLFQCRNHTYEIDYEIVLDERTYAEVADKDLPDISEEED